MKTRLGIILATAVGTMGFGRAAAAPCDGGPVWLDSLDLAQAQVGWGRPQVNRSIRGGPLKLGARVHARGVCVHAHSKIWVALPGGAGRFVASVGVDDSAGAPGSVSFIVRADGRKLFDSGVMRAGDAPKAIDVPLDGVRSLLLHVADGGDGRDSDHADWAEARFVLGNGRSVSVVAAPPPPLEELVILTPAPGPAPRINGPGVYGCRPGNPFLYRVPTTGARPIEFSAEGLPPGLRLDSGSGILSGTVRERGTSVVTLRARNARGSAGRRLKIVCGDRLTLTPPMGWNHWYAHYNRVTDAMMRDAADCMVSSGMADVGYAYVSIDDCWMNAPESPDPLRVGPLRDARGEIVPNRHFPDMKALADHIHARGLKAGIYTSPGPLTCGKFCGSFGHEEQDARTFARWGYDLLKYDWCSYGKVPGVDPRKLESLQRPYRLMGTILKRLPRDIVFNLCQYGMGDVWEWGEAVGGHSWRTGGDLGFELDRIFEVALRNAAHGRRQRPGAWNDPDYIQIGYIGRARAGGPGRHGMPEPCGITPSEQYAFMTLWCLMGSPLFYSGDMTRLDPFTLNVLCNPEVIDINQDALGRCARVVPLADELFAMVKEMEDGSRAVGFFNQGELPTPVAARWADLGIGAGWHARDPWRQRDLGTVGDRYEGRIARRGCVLLRLQPPD